MTDIARLRITLDDINPVVMRRIEAPLDITLDTLHSVIQAAMGWEDAHLYEFRVGRDAAYGIPDPDWPETRTLSAKNVLLQDLLAQTKKNLTYVYDFGDDWTHTITVEAVAPGTADVLYPRLIAAEGCCPPEDCGGPAGFADFMDAMADPKHENHADVVEWHGGIFDPKKIDQIALGKKVERIAKKLAGKKPPSTVKPKTTRRK